MIPFYLKRIEKRPYSHFILSETYADRGILKSRDLLDLGPDPTIYIEYTWSGHGFYFKPELEESLRRLGVRYTSEDLESVFMPFIRPDIRTIIERFHHAHRSRTSINCDLDDLAKGGRRVHIFDARRLYYLRFGRMDSGELSLKHWKFLNVFLCKSRDEIESAIDRMERRLPPGEFATYVYASLGIPLLYPQYLRENPAAMDRYELDEYVQMALCGLNVDENFFLGVDRDDWGGLHKYLQKYAWLYFDSDFTFETWFEGFFFGYRFTPRSEPAPRISVQVAFEVFGITGEEFNRMSRKQLISLYRRKAKKRHPDKGGRHDDFLKLSEAYEQLLGLKHPQNSEQ